MVVPSVVVLAVPPGQRLERRQNHRPALRVQHPSNPDHATLAGLELPRSGLNSRRLVRRGAAGHVTVQTDPVNRRQAPGELVMVGLSKRSGHLRELEVEYVPPTGDLLEVLRHLGAARTTWLRAETFDLVDKQPNIT